MDRSAHTPPTTTTTATTTALVPVVPVGTSPEIAGRPATWELTQLPPEWREHPVALWLRNLRREKTRAAYLGEIALFARWLRETRGVGDVLSATYNDLLAYRETLEQSGLRPVTRANRLRRLSSLYAFLAKRGLIARNPLDGLNIPQRGRRVNRFQAWTMEEIGRFFSAISDDGALVHLRDRALFRILFRNGLRVSEVAGLNVGHLRVLDRRVVLDLIEDDGREFIKAGDDEIAVLLPSTVRDVQAYLAARGIALADVLERRPGSEAWLHLPLFAATQTGGRPYDPRRRSRLRSTLGLAAASLGETVAGDPATPEASETDGTETEQGKQDGQDGGRLSARTIHQRMRWYGCDPNNKSNARLRAEICHPHAARTTFATTLAKLGIPVREIMTATRHKSLAAVQVYIDAEQSVAENAANRIPY